MVSKTNVVNKSSVNTSNSISGIFSRTRLRTILDRHACTDSTFKKSLITFAVNLQATVVAGLSIYLNTHNDKTEFSSLLLVSKTQSIVPTPYQLPPVVTTPTHQASADVLIYQPWWLHSYSSRKQRPRIHFRVSANPLELGPTKPGFAGQPKQRVNLPIKFEVDLTDEQGRVQHFETMNRIPLSLSYIVVDIKEAIANAQQCSTLEHESNGEMLSGNATDQHLQPRYQQYPSVRFDHNNPTRIEEVTTRTPSRIISQELSPPELLQRPSTQIEQQNLNMERTGSQEEFQRRNSLLSPMNNEGFNPFLKTKSPCLNRKSSPAPSAFSFASPRYGSALLQQNSPSPILVLIPETTDLLLQPQHPSQCQLQQHEPLPPVVLPPLPDPGASIKTFLPILAILVATLASVVVVSAAAFSMSRKQPTRRKPRTLYCSHGIHVCSCQECSPCAYDATCYCSCHAEIARSNNGYGADSTLREVEFTLPFGVKSGRQDHNRTYNSV